MTARPRPRSGCRTAAPRAFPSGLSVTDGDIAAEGVSDYPGFDPAVTGLPLRRHLSPAWATFSLAAWARAIPIAHSTRLDVRVLRTAGPMHEFAGNGVDV